MNGLMPDGILAKGLLAILTCGFIVAFTSVFTRWRCSTAICRFQSADKTGIKSVLAPPHLPYRIPLVGNTIQFLKSAPNAFWHNITDSMPTHVGVYTALLGGESTHLVFDHAAINAFYKAKSVTRTQFVLDVLSLGFGLNRSDATTFYTATDEQDQMMHSYLLKTAAANELAQVFLDRLSSRLSVEPDVQETQLIRWLNGHTFDASTSTLFGSELMAEYPGLGADFWKITQQIILFLFRTPRFLKPEPYARRDRLLDHFAKWQNSMMERCGNEPEDPDSNVKWEPIFGSRLSRARHRFYLKCGMEPRSCAGANLAILFAQSGNSIPAIGWTLLHIVCPKQGESVLDKIMSELKTAVSSDGMLDLVQLERLPLLQSVQTEALRMYTDVMISRQLPEDVTLPVQDGQTNVRLSKGSTVMIPTYLPHHNPLHWDQPKQFCPFRFIVPSEEKKDAAKGREEKETKGQIGDHPDARKDCPVFSMAGTTGRFVAFGGGRGSCPGRKFARQEILIGVATVLLMFDITVDGFVDGDGRPTAEYPKGRPPIPAAGVMHQVGDVKVTIRKRPWLGAPVEVA